MLRKMLLFSGGRSRSRKADDGKSKRIEQIVLQPAKKSLLFHRVRFDPQQPERSKIWGNGRQKREILFFPLVSELYSLLKSSMTNRIHGCTIVWSFYFSNEKPKILRFEQNYVFSIQKHHF